MDSLNHAIIVVTGSFLLPDNFLPFSKSKSMSALWFHFHKQCVSHQTWLDNWNWINTFLFFLNENDVGWQFFSFLSAKEAKKSISKSREGFFNTFSEYRKKQQRALQTSIFLKQINNLRRCFHNLRYYASLGSLRASTFSRLSEDLCPDFFSSSKSVPFLFDQKHENNNNLVFSD